MHYIKDIFNNNKTEHAHSKFIRYSKGKFVGPLLKVKIQKEKIKISGSFHYIDEFLEIIANELKSKIIHIKSNIIWNKDLTEELEKLGIKYTKVSKSRGIFNYTLDNEVNLKKFTEAFNKYNLLVNFKTDNFSFVTKSKLPKPNKEFSADFCKILIPKTMKDEFFKEFLFDILDKEIKNLEIKHEIEINDIDIPKNKPFEEARRLAIRKGTIIRKIYLNSEETPIETKINFEV